MRDSKKSKFIKEQEAGRLITKMIGVSYSKWLTHSTCSILKEKNEWNNNQAFISGR